MKDLILKRVVSYGEHGNYFNADFTLEDNSSVSKGIKTEIEKLLQYVKNSPDNGLHQSESGGVAECSGCIFDEYQFSGVLSDIELDESYTGSRLNRWL